MLLHELTEPETEIAYRAVVAAVSPLFKDWCESHNHSIEEGMELDDILFDVLKNTYSKDAYDMARTLEDRFSFQPDYSLIALLDTCTNLLSKAIIDTRAEGLKRAGIEARLKQGDIVEITSQESAVTLKGRIMRIVPHGFYVIEVRDQDGLYKTRRYPWSEIESNNYAPH